MGDWRWAGSVVPKRRKRWSLREIRKRIWGVWRNGLKSMKNELSLPSFMFIQYRTDDLYLYPPAAIDVQSAID